jgi:hypothetical protein
MYIVNILNLSCMRKIFASILIFVFAFITLSVTKVSAKVITSQSGGVVVAKTEVINDDLFIGAQTVEIAGTVNGDVFVGAQTLKVTGVINGSLHVGANTVDIEGTVKGNVYAGASSILVTGSKIGGSLLAGTATINVDKDTTIGGSILVGAGSATINSQVKRSVYAGTGSLTIGDNAVIGKDLYYSADKNQAQANISTKAKIAGSIFKSTVSTPQTNINVPKQLTSAIAGARISISIFSFVSALLIGLLYFKLFGKHLNQTSGLVTGSFWKSLGVGFLVTIALIPGLIVLLITIVGIPVAGLALLIFTLYASLAKIVVGLAFGGWITGKFKWKVSAFWTFALGLLVIDIVRIIPVIGGITGFTVFLVGLGALTLQMFQRS